VKQTFGAEVFVDVRPVHALPGSDQPPVCSLRWSCFGQSPRPRERDTNHATVCKMRYYFVVGDSHILYEWFAASHNVHAKQSRHAKTHD
jgi:hypothetical protein